MTQRARTSTGVAGLDHILAGGFPRDRMYLVQGDPGVGKTTLGLQFILEGMRANETCMYIALSESKVEIESVAESHGWRLDGVHIVELTAVEQQLGLESENTLFEPSEVELQETTRYVLSEVDRLKPDRIVVDSLSELRLLAQTALRYRRQILALKQYFADRRTTVLLLDDRTSNPTDLQLQSLAHGVVTLEHVAPLYGADRRRLRVAKLRGVRFHSGYHDFTIRTGGLEVFPRLVAQASGQTFPNDHLSSGIAGLDTMLGGGLDYGTTTLLLGPAGTGKSSVAIQYVVAALKRGEKAALFLFDERMGTMLARTDTLGCQLRPYIESGMLQLEQIDPAEMGSGEFACRVKNAVEKTGCRLIVIDSLNGYLHAMADEKQISVQLHELLSYLGNLGIATVIVMAQHGLVGSMQTPVDISYLADTVVLLRYFESGGRIHKAVSVLKKRSGRHEDAIRELTIGPGVDVGAPLAKFDGVLTGVPRFVGAIAELAERD